MDSLSRMTQVVLKQPVDSMTVLWQRLADSCFLATPLADVMIVYSCYANLQGHWHNLVDTDSTC